MTEKKIIYYNFKAFIKYKEVERLTQKRFNIAVTFECECFDGIIDDVEDLLYNLDQSTFISANDELREIFNELNDKNILKCVLLDKISNEDLDMEWFENAISTYITSEKPNIKINNITIFTN